MTSVRVHYNVGPSKLKAHTSATDAAVLRPPASSPQKENALPNMTTSPLHGLSEPYYSQQLQQQPPPSVTHAVSSHHRLSRLPSANSSSTAQQLGGDHDTPSARQQAVWVGLSAADTDTAIAGRGCGQEASRDTAAAEAVCLQLEGLQLTPLQQLLKLCGQQVRPVECAPVVLSELD